VETTCHIGVVLEGPMGIDGDVGVAARAQCVRFPLDGQRRSALYDEDYRLRLAVGVGLLRPTTSADFDDVLAERFGKARQRPCKDPSAGFVPERQVGRHNIAHRPLGDDGIGFGKNGAICEQLRLRRMATLRGVICRLFHNSNLTH
jgi:hypothetical protein